LVAFLFLLLLGLGFISVLSSTAAFSFAFDMVLGANIGVSKISSLRRHQLVLLGLELGLPGFTLAYFGYGGFEILFGRADQGHRLFAISLLHVGDDGRPHDGQRGCYQRKPRRGTRQLGCYDLGKVRHGRRWSPACPGGQHGPLLLPQRRPCLTNAGVASRSIFRRGFDAACRGSRTNGRGR
jgi:hypothetical protein